MRAKLLAVLVLGTLPLTGCPGGDDEDRCADVTCGTNAACLPDTGVCDCNTGYDDVEGACLNSRQVPCTPGNPPAHATAVTANVTITFDGTTWSTPATCAWQCLTDYDGIGNQCIDTQMVPCEDAAPDHATSTVVNVEITFTTAGGWTDPATCAWDCDANYDQIGIACLDSQLVECTDAAPDHATSTVADVEISYTDAGGWTDPADCTWHCDADFDQVGLVCLDSRMVPCTDAAPDHATSTVADVAITYTDLGGWTTPADCDWACDTGYDRIGIACLDRRMVPCDDVAPDNATSTVVDVEITFDGTTWSEAADCAWDCLTDYFNTGSACINSRTEPCAAGTPPANAHDVIADVTSTYTTAGGWQVPVCDWACEDTWCSTGIACAQTQQEDCSPNATLPDHAQDVVMPVDVACVGTTWETPATCAWACETDYAPEGEACLHDKLVPCDPSGVPAHSTATAGDVTVTYTGTYPDGAWSAPAACAFLCDDGFHQVDVACIHNHHIDWCNVQAPEVYSAQEAYATTVYGQILVNDVGYGGTASAGALAGIDAMLCHAPSIACPADGQIDLAALTCETAAFNVNAANNDEYGVTIALPNTGAYDYVFAFSSDGGLTWQTCDTTAAGGLLTCPDTAVPGRANILNNGLEAWTDPATPTGWTVGSMIGVEQVAAIHAGSYAAKLTRNGAANANVQVLLDFPAVAGTTYTASAWFLDNDPTARAAYGLQFLDAAKVNIGATSWPTGVYTVDSAEPQEFTFASASAPANTAWMRVLVRVYGVPNSTTVGGSVTLDALTVTP